jgi:hypothetical protein
MLRKSSLIAAVAASDRADVPKKVAGRFGLVPKCFCSAPDAPHVVIRELWAFAKSAYLDTPIPTLPLPFTQTFAPNSAQKPEPSLEVIIVAIHSNLGCTPLSDLEGRVVSG